MKTRIASCLLLLGFASSSFGQTGAMAPQQVALKTVNGLTQPIPNATITVCAPNTPGLPCSPALTGTIFQDTALTLPLSNPFVADGLGNYQFAATSGNYTVTVTAPGFNGQSYQVSIGGNGGGGAGNPGTPLGSVQGNNNSFFQGIPNSSRKFQHWRREFSFVADLCGRHVFPGHKWESKSKYSERVRARLLRARTE